MLESLVNSLSGEFISLAQSLEQRVVTRRIVGIEDGNPSGFTGGNHGAGPLPDRSGLVSWLHQFRGQCRNRLARELRKRDQNLVTQSEGSRCASYFAARTLSSKQFEDHAPQCWKCLTCVRA